MQYIHVMKVRHPRYLIAFGINLKKIIDSKKKTPEDVAALGNIETKQVTGQLTAKGALPFRVWLRLHEV